MSKSKKPKATERVFVRFTDNGTSEFTCRRVEERGATLCLVDAGRTWGTVKLPLQHVRWWCVGYEETGE